VHQQQIKAQPLSYMHVMSDLHALFLAEDCIHLENEGRLSQAGGESSCS